MRDVLLLYPLWLLSEHTCYVRIFKKLLRNSFLCVCVYNPTEVVIRKIQESEG